MILHEFVWTTYQPSEYLFADCYIPSQGSDLYDAQLTETLLWFSARKFELWKMISNEQPREWHRLPVTTCFRSKTTQVNNLNRGGLSRGGNCENLLSPFLFHLYLSLVWHTYATTMQNNSFCAPMISNFAKKFLHSFLDLFSIWTFLSTAIRLATAKSEHD